ncbi:MAG: tetratricopeptide repeat protein [Verrucomicrobiota bacterium]
MQKLRFILLAVAFLGFSSSMLTAASSKPRKVEEPPGIKAYNKGTELLFEEEFEEAEVQLREAVKEDPKLAEAYNNLAYVLRKQGSDHFEESLEFYNKAIQLEPKLSEAYMYRGVLYVQMGDQGKALEDHAVLERLKPSLAEELQYVIETGQEKVPAQFFGVTPED